MKKKLSLYLQSAFYVLAGANHFISPAFYYDLIPDYLPFPGAINTISGLLEMVLGLGLLFQPTRKLAAFTIIAMMVAFIPSHVYFIQLGGCVEGGLCAPPWVGWLRLVLIHPLLIYWAWSHKA